MTHRSSATSSRSPFDKAADASDGLAAAGRDIGRGSRAPRTAPRPVGRAHPDPDGLRPSTCPLRWRFIREATAGAKFIDCTGRPRPLRAAGPRQPADARAGEGQRRPGGSLAGTRPRRDPQAGRARAGGRRAAPRQAPRRVESGHVQFLHDVPAHDLTYDDVFMVPRHSAVASRYDVDLSTSDGTGTTLPLVVANMTAIAGKRMAETVARRGGLTVIPQDIPLPVVADVVSWVKKRHHVFDTPIELRPDQTVAEALSLIPKRAHRAAVVVDGGRPVGVVSRGRLRRGRPLRPGRVGDEPRGRDRRGGHRPARGVRRHRPRQGAVRGRPSPPTGALVGVLTRLGALRATLYTPARRRERRAADRRRRRRQRGRRGPGCRAPRGRCRLPRRRHRPRPPGADAARPSPRYAPSTRRSRSRPATSCRPRARAR